MRDFKTGVLIIAFFLIGHHLRAQWGAPYSNSWIDYHKPYVRIGILKKGLHRVPFSSLPKGFATDSPDKFQLWRRGKEVAIISTANQEILFYALPNDGASDSLLYRPMSARMNPYFSMYSDEGAYFLTVGSKPGSRAKVIDQPADESVPVVTHHNELVTAIFQQDYSLGTKSAVNPGFFNSFFEIGASRTSLVFEEAKGEEALFNFKLKEFANVPQNPTVRLLLHGRSKNDRKIELYIGKSKDALRLVKTLDNTGFEGIEYAFEIKPEDLDAGKNGVLRIRSVSGERLERFSIAYYSIEYPQLLKPGDLPAKEFRLGAVNAKWSRISLEGVTNKFSFLDISDSEKPIVLKRTDKTLMVPREPGKKQVLFVASEITDVPVAKITEVSFKIHDPKSANYIIITTEELRQGATTYANYRASTTGGGLKPAIFDIQDLYNQFNYGEPSPVAIKKFMSYMLSDGNKNKYLFLIGKSITQNERMVRELPGEVPTIGFPGSDALLVEEIAGAPVNAPAIPVGRLSAITNQNIIDYLQKVKAYENDQTMESGWRKKILHLSGGKTTSEIVQLRDYLKALEPMVQKGVVGGSVKSYAKKQPTQEVEAVDISGDINEGVGMITFFGHGSTIITDPDIGHVRDAARGYHNLNKYPVMYFGGCGVGNIFCNRFNPTPANPKSADRITLSLDWLVAPDRGAIAVIASSFESYVSPGVTYLNALYHHMFEDPATASLPIGKIQWMTANAILSQYNDKYNIAYVHQSILQGDPALRLLTAAGPDYAVDGDEGITLLSGFANKTIGESDSLRVSIALSNLGRFVEGQNVPVEVEFSGSNGTLTQVSQVKSFASQQVLQVSFVNKRDAKFIKVKIDPAETLKDLNRGNNAAELLVDWDVVKGMSKFSNKSLKDIVPPILAVKADGRLLKQGEPVSPNPKISIALTDDRVLPGDTALVDIFIKPCINDECDFERIVYAGDNIKMEVSESWELGLEYQTTLGPGKYEILVNARDHAGNAVSQPYRMIFEIGNQEEMQCSLVVSPNPATSYLRFELNAAKSLPLKAIRYLIYDQRGREVESKVLTVSDNASTIEWYWGRGSVGPGLYSYKVFLEGKNGEMLDIKAGRVVLIP